MVKIKSAKTQIVAFLVVAIALSLMFTTVQTVQAHAYTLLKTKSDHINNRCWVMADSTGYLEFIGSDPYGPENNMNSVNGIHKNKVSAYQFSLANAKDLKWTDYTMPCMYNPGWTRGGAYFGHGSTSYKDCYEGSMKANGTGVGCYATYGYGWGKGGLAYEYGGLDALMYVHTYVTDDLYNSKNFYGSVDFWPRVKIVYNKNTSASVTNLPAAHFKYIGQEEKLRGTPKRTGYTFEGWSTKPKGPVNLEVGQVIGYEDWNLKKYETVPKGQIYGDGFHEWQDNPDVGVPSPSGSNTITLYAQWKPVNYYVDYLGNGATAGSTASSYHTYDVTKNLTPNGYSRSYNVTCYAQGGSAGNKSVVCKWPYVNWNRAANGSSTAYADKASVRNLASTMNTRISLYAQWRSNQITLPDPGSRASYEFTGWYTAASGGSKLGNAGTVITVSSNMSVYAQWKPLTRVEYYVDGGKTPIYAETVYADTSYSVKAAATDAGTKKDCEKFDAWYSNASYTTKFVNGTKVSGTTYKLYGRNAARLTYDTTSRSTVLASPEFDLYFDSAMTKPLTNVKTMYPASKLYWVGQKVNFDMSKLSLYYKTQRIDRILHPAKGVYMSSDASGQAAASHVIMRNVTVYVDWPWPVYDGVLDQRDGRNFTR